MTFPSDTVPSLIDTATTHLLIDGDWIDTPDHFPVEDPATGEVIAQVADATPVHGMQALAAADAALTSWAGTDPRVRSEILRRAYELIADRADELAILITAEMGKPLAQARGEVDYGGEFFRWYAEEAVRISGRYTVAPSGGTRLITVKQPVGPVFAVTPWNFPLAMVARKIAPALAAGCTVILKPAALTPLTSLALARLLLEAGVPAGVVNIVPTSTAGALSEPIIRDPRTRKLTFTGSTDVGKRLIEQGAEQVLRVSMELGGNAPFIVCADADLDKAIDGAMLAKMRNNGEACTAANRFLVHNSLAPEFARRLGERMAGLVIGSGLDPATELGPMIDSAAVTRITALVDDAVAAGATIAAVGATPTGTGYFYPATVLTDIPAHADILHEEIFGPVAPITTFDDDFEALTAANATEYGLIGYVYSENISRAITFAEGLQTGMVGINQGAVSNPAAPFGGIKSSGVGREGGSEGIEEYLETKYLGLAL